jgi:hypothetical protein
MTTIHVEFSDITLDPQSARSGAKPAMGLPDSWLDALIGAGYVERRNYVAPGVLKSIIARFPSRDHRDQFACSVRLVSNLMGTRAVVSSEGV